MEELWNYLSYNIHSKELTYRQQSDLRSHLNMTRTAQKMNTLGEGVYRQTARWSHWHPFLNMENKLKNQIIHKFHRLLSFNTLNAFPRYFRSLQCNVHFLRDIWLTLTTFTVCSALCLSQPSQLQTFPWYLFCSNTLHTALQVFPFSSFGVLNSKTCHLSTQRHPSFEFPSSEWCFFFWSGGKISFDTTFPAFLGYWIID